MNSTHDIGVLIFSVFIGGLFASVLIYTVTAKSITKALWGVLLMAVLAVVAMIWFGGLL